MVTPYHQPKMSRGPHERPVWVALVLVGLCLLLPVALKTCVGTASASSLSCEGIKDPDRRHFCRALAKGEPSECEFIRSPDLRNECRALVRDQRRALVKKR